MELPSIIALRELWVDPVEEEARSGGAAAGWM
jgi:hypothetical protein